MPDSPDVIAHSLNVLNQKYGLDVKIDKVEDSKLLPNVNKRMMIMRFNIRLLPLFMLYRMGNADIVVKYFLTHKYMSYSMYSEAEHWLKRTEVKFKKVKAKNEGLLHNLIGSAKSLNQSHLEDFNMQLAEILMYQQLFVLLHEYSHVLFHHKEECRKDYFNRIRESLEEFEDGRDKSNSILKEISKELPWGTRSFLMDNIGYGFVARNLELIKYLSEDNRKVEEFACDLHAWHILASILHYGGYSLEEQEVVFTNAIEALYYLENYKALDDCLSYKVDMSKAENIALFDSMRYSVLTHTIVLYLEGKEKGRGLAFDRQFSIFRWEERKDFISLINKFVPLTKDLMEGAKIPNSELSLPLYKRINAFESEIMNYVLK